MRDAEGGAARHGEVVRVATRVVVLPAPPEGVWPWLVQMGYGRGGWYAIDALERALGVGRFATGGSARRIEPALQDLTLGGRMPLSAHRWLDVAVLEPARTLVLALPPGRLGFVWAFRLEPAADGHATRLAVTTRTRLTARGPAGRLVARAALAVLAAGHAVMERVQHARLARRVARPDGATT